MSKIESKKVLICGHAAKEREEREGGIFLPGEGAHVHVEKIPRPITKWDELYHESSGNLRMIMQQVMDLEKRVEKLEKKDA